jgi:hypothetical protein
MSVVTIGTPSEKCALTNPGGNSTSATLVKPKPTFTNPTKTTGNGLVTTGDGVLSWGEGGSEANSGFKLTFFGVGADTGVGIANVYGWEQTIQPNNVGAYTLWVPTLLAAFTFELDSNMPGVLGTIVPATDPVAQAANYFATAITLTTGNSGISVEVVSPGHGNDIAHAIIDAKGARHLEVRYSMNSAAITSANAIWKRM